MGNITTSRGGFFFNAEQQDKFKIFKNSECRLNFRFDHICIYLQVLRLDLSSVCLWETKVRLQSSSICFHQIEREVTFMTLTPSDLPQGLKL